MTLDYFIRKQSILLAKENKSYIRKNYFNLLDSKERLVGIVGARGVGKTTVILQYLASLEEKFLYIMGDDIAFGSVLLYDIVDEFYALGGRVVAIDEIHRYDNWAREIKNLYDSFPDLTIRISGSSMLNILYEQYDLSRRIVLHTMPSLSFREYLELEKAIKLSSYSYDDIIQNGVEISKELVFGHSFLYGEFKNYLRYGAYPFYLESLEGFDIKLFNALEKIIHEDIPSLNKIEYGHISIFQKLIYRLVESQKPFSVNMASLAREFGVSQPTLYGYMEILDRSAIFKSMRKYSKKLSKKPQKLLFSNTNILYAYAKRFEIEVDIGTVRETFFANCFDKVFYSDVGDFKVGDNIFGIGGKNKNFVTTHPPLPQKP